MLVKQYHYLCTCQQTNGSASSVKVYAYTRIYTHLTVLGRWSNFLYNFNKINDEISYTKNY